MALADRLRTLRRELGLSQEAFGAQGFVSAPGWVKIENGQRQASEKLIERLCRWLVADKYMRVSATGTLREELLTLKYLGSPSAFVRAMATAHAHQLTNAPALLSTGERAKPRRGRPAGAVYPKKAAATR